MIRATPGERPLLLLLALLATIVGCSDPAAAPLIGRWNVSDPGRVAKRVNPDDPEIPPDFADETGSRMTIEFRAMGGLHTMTRMGNVRQEKTGSWRVVGHDVDASRLRIECQLGGQTTRCDVALLDDGRIRLEPPNMAGTNLKMTFERE